MLTRLKEGSSTKCEDYTGGFLGASPVQETSTVGDIEVSGQQHWVCQAYRHHGIVSFRPTAPLLVGGQ